jgi:hypothetical protein
MPNICRNGIIYFFAPENIRGNKKTAQNHSRVFGSPRTPQFKPYVLQCSLQLSLYYHQEIPSAKQKAIINS